MTFNFVNRNLSDLGLNPRKTYEYKYEGTVNFGLGMPNLAESGVRMTCRVKIVGASAQTFVLQVRVTIQMFSECLKQLRPCSVALTMSSTFLSSSIHRQMLLKTLENTGSIIIAGVFTDILEGREGTQAKKGPLQHLYHASLFPP